MTSASARCKRCRRPIWFGITVKGRRQPLDPNPCEEGTVIVDVLEKALHRLADLDAAMIGTHVRTLAKGEDPGPDVPRYTPHPSTCPKR